MTNIVVHRATEAEISHQRRSGTLNTINGPMKFRKGWFILTIAADQWAVPPDVINTRYKAKTPATQAWIDECLRWNRENGIE